MTVIRAEPGDTHADTRVLSPYLRRSVGALDGVIRSWPEAERPSGPRPPIRFMLAVSWRRKWVGFVQPLTV